MAKVPYLTPPLDYNTQLQQLKNRGLHIGNPSKARHILENISYYRLSGYWYPMLADPKSAHTFKAGSTFDNAFRLYCFDRELRAMILGELEKIEVAVRSKMIYVLSHKHGTFWYTNPALFSKQAGHTKTLASMDKELSRSDERFIKDFVK